MEVEGVWEGRGEVTLQSGEAVCMDSMGGCIAPLDQPCVKGG